ncbi:putative c6 transcription factor [Phaeomoniella chlamydospora]|uniref:Putative c6 transcription factor n=1 Tax=Phaeomoniella chlamydospora TaxID=158046 RepID=A0A0G2E881_PHACM|nr:putative c6 transcription factor [Phaeomoniella chlamydospora]
MTSKLETEKHVSLYYLYFHPAHPILVPQKVHASRNYPDYLQHVIQYIGSHYLPVPTTTLYSGIMAELCRTDIKSPCMVQARLLYSIALNGCNDIKNAQWILAAAVQLALELGMNERDFAEIHSGGLPIEAESLRRTWWELYVVDGYMAALWRKSGFSANSVDPDVLLPCEESLYSEGACASQSPSFSQFNRRYFVDDDINFSSFCYRIDAVRILARVLALTANQEVNDDEVQAVDNALAGWVLHLPYTKSEIINTFGEVDEILFQAHMIIQYANIYLHFPRSNLLHTLAANADITGSQKDLKAPPTSTQHIHTVKAIEASKHLSNLAALRLPNQRHTPFFICGLVLGAVVQLSACSAHNGRCAEQHRDRIILILGVLKSLRRTWSLTRIVCQQLKKVAVEVFESERPKSRGNPMTAEDMITAPTLDPDDQTWFENFDIQALQNMMHFDTRMIYSETI